jgi:hypothetical protein
MSRASQDFGVIAGKKPWIRHSVAEKHYPEPIRRKMAYNFFHGKVLRVCVRIIRERWSEYRNHQDFWGLHPGFANA